MIPIDPKQNHIAEKLFNALWSQLSECNPASKEVVATKRLYTIVKTGDNAEVEDLKGRLKGLVLASPQKIREIIKSRSKYKLEKSWNFKKIYSLLSSRGSTLGKSVTFSAEEFVEQLGITVCPYCNRQFVNNTVDDKGKRRTSQLDHFFPKSNYSYLGLSFYNLIPVCGSCNLKKLEGKLTYSPYEISSDSPDVNVDEYIKFTYKLRHGDILANPQSIAIEMNEQDKGSNSFKRRLALEDHYKIHNDYVYDLIKKKELYDDHYLNELFDNAGGLFNSPDELRRVLWGNYTKKDELHKRPLAKLTRDILREIAPEALEDE